MLDEKITGLKKRQLDSIKTPLSDAISTMIDSPFFSILFSLFILNFIFLFVELNENFKTQYHEVFKIMKKYNFNLTYNAKANSILYYDKHGIHEKSKKFSKTFNFHFSKIKK